MLIDRAFKVLRLLLGPTMLLGILGVGGCHSASLEGPAASSSAARSHSVVWAVVADSGEKAPSALAVAKLQEALGLEDGIALVDREEIDRVIKEQDLTASGFVRAEHALQLGHLLGADAILFVERLPGSEHIVLTPSTRPTRAAGPVCRIRMVDAHTGRFLGGDGFLESHLEKDPSQLIRAVRISVPKIERVPTVDKRFPSGLLALMRIEDRLRIEEALKSKRLSRTLAHEATLMGRPSPPLDAGADPEDFFSGVLAWASQSDNAEKRVAGAMLKAALGMFQDSDAVRTAMGVLAKELENKSSGVDFAADTPLAEMTRHGLRSIKQDRDLVHYGRPILTHVIQHSKKADLRLWHTELKRYIEALNRLGREKEVARLTNLLLATEDPDKKLHQDSEEDSFARWLERLRLQSHRGNGPGPTTDSTVPSDGAPSDVP